MHAQLAATMAVQIFNGRLPRLVHARPRLVTAGRIGLSSSLATDTCTSVSLESPTMARSRIGLGRWHRGCLASPAPYPSAQLRLLLDSSPSSPGPTTMLQLACSCSPDASLAVVPFNALSSISYHSMKHWAEEVECMLLSSSRAAQSLHHLSRV